MNALNCRKSIAFWLTIALLSSTLTACDGVLEMGVEHTPTPDQAATATVSALATENANLATQVATLAVHTHANTSPRETGLHPGRRHLGQGPTRR